MCAQGSCTRRLGASRCKARREAGLGAAEAGGRRRGLCGGGGGNRGASEQKNSRFFVQVNISARGPCLTGNALADPFCTTKGSWYDHRSYCRSPLLPRNAPGAPTIVVVREENYFIFHVGSQVARSTGRRMAFVRKIFSATGFLDKPKGLK